MRATVFALLALCLAAAAAAAVEVPYYGNNCGPGYSKGNPIDAADAACEWRKERESAHPRARTDPTTQVQAWHVHASYGGR
jgi:hypothetical protein